MTPDEISKLNELIAKGYVEVMVRSDVSGEVPRVTEKALRPENVRDVHETTARYLAGSEGRSTLPPTTPVP